ncbi:MAG: hypothetical protein AB7R89_01885 [Dehalococcoidia bacterium]
MAHWFTVYVREAHPGENYPAPSLIGEKRAHAVDLRWLEALPWPVLVDDIDGTVHRAYGELPNSAYVIDAEGRVAFKDQWASAGTLRRALDALRERGGRGAPIAGGVERRPHPLGPMAFGWPAIRRAGSGAVRDVLLKAPPLALMLQLGRALRPGIAPLARRTRPLPTPVRLAIAVVTAALIGGLALRPWKRAAADGRRR